MVIPMKFTVRFARSVVFRAMVSVLLATALLAKDEPAAPPPPAEPMAPAPTPPRNPTAQEILDKAMKLHGALTEYAGTATSRGLQMLLISEEGQEIQAARFEIKHQHYRYIDLKMRQPGEWAVRSDRQSVYSQDTGSHHSEFNRVVLIKGKTTPPMMANVSGRNPKVVLAEPIHQAFNEILQSAISRSYGSENLQGDLVLRYSLPNAKGLGNIAWGLLSPVIKREEVGPGGEKVYCIAAKSSSKGRPVLMWVEAVNFRVVRVVQLASERIDQMKIQNDYVGRNVSFTETVYTRVTDRALADEDFTVANTEAVDFTEDQNQTRFLPFQEILELLAEDIKQADPEYKASLQRAAQRVEDAAQKAAIYTAKIEPKRGQYLTAEQMGGIVLVEGDKGRASGFMTKIKGVDFVVTNLHVIGSNSTITLKNLRGEVIPYTAIFGAVGRDVAILRIGKAGGDLRLATDLVNTVKIGEGVVVVGNRQGGGVATEMVGAIKGLGPDRIEIDAAFQQGNSGSPIFSAETKEVIAVATYLQSQAVNVAEEPGAWGLRGRSFPVETRWFGFRLDGPLQWQAIELTRWQAQGKRIDKFRAMSDGLLAVLRLRFNEVIEQPRLLAIIEDFNAKAKRAGSNNTLLADEVKGFLRKVRAIAEEDVRELSTGEFYDYYRTCLYWDDSVPAQLEYRAAIIRVLKSMEENPQPLMVRVPRS